VHAALARLLHIGDAHGGVGAGDEEAAIRDAEHRARFRGVLGGREARAEALELRGPEHREVAGLRVEGADAARDLRGGARPVEARVVALDLGRVGRELLVLHRLDRLAQVE
jgi:hypothetical protein